MCVSKTEHLKSTIFKYSVLDSFLKKPIYFEGFCICEANAKTENIYHSEGQQFFHERSEVKKLDLESK